MKIQYYNNAEIVIQANVNKEGDYDEVLKVANKMIELDLIDVDIASADEHEQWVHICARWDHYQAKEMKDLYQAAKAAL